MIPLAGEDLVPGPPGTTHPLVSPIALFLSTRGLKLPTSWGIWHLRFITSFSVLSLPSLIHFLTNLYFALPCESWTIKKAECQRIEAFKPWYWVPWTARRSNQSILKQINPEYSLEGLMLKFQYFGHLIQRANSLEKTLMLGKIKGRRRRGRQRMRWLEGITDSKWTWVWATAGR